MAPKTPKAPTGERHDAPAPPATKTTKRDETLVKVRAFRMGEFDLKRRREGDVFLIPRWRFSDTWMEEVDAHTPERLTTGKEQLQKEHADIRALKSPALMEAPTGNTNVLG